MAEVSFALPTATEKPVVVPQTVETPVAGVTVDCIAGAGPALPSQIAPPLAVATRASQVSVALPLGDTVPSFEDIILPRIYLVQKVGELSNIYSHGSLLFNSSNQNTVIYEAPVVNPADGKTIKPGSAPLELVVLGFKTKRFVERTDGQTRGQIVNTEAEVAKAGGTLAYQEWELKKAEGIRLFQPIVECLVVIFKPEGFNDESGTVFGYDIGGRKALLALWSMKGSAFTKGARTFYTARSMGCLRGGYPTFSWNLSTRLEKFGTGNFAYVPVLTPKAKTPDAVIDFAREVLTGGAAPAE